MRSSAILVLLLVACSDAQPTREASVEKAAPPEDLRTAPHSGAIDLIAITDDGRTAYSIDTLGQGRVWPTLDGMREPVIARGGRAVEVALARTEDGFVAALRDEVGGIDLVRFTTFGTSRGHVTLPPEPGFERVVAARDGVLALRRDQFLVWYDENGKKRGQMSPAPGERIVSVAVRGTHAVAMIANADGQASPRRIELGVRIAWGESLPASPIAPPIAISPDGALVAGVGTRTRRFTVANLATGEQVYEAESRELMSDALVTVGFLDDRTAMLTSNANVWWWAPALADPWETTRRTMVSESSDVAIGDGMVLDATSTSLTLTTPSSTMFLGYADVGTNRIFPSTSGLRINRDNRITWLDRELRESVRDDAALPPPDDEGPSNRAQSSTGIRALAAEGEITAFDSDTDAVRWSHRVEATEIVFSKDGKTLFASGPGGLISLDAATGKRIATACGWSFGLHIGRVSPNVFPVENLCSRDE